jgi:hypothetical protein
LINRLGVGGYRGREVGKSRLPIGTIRPELGSKGYLNSASSNFAAIVIPLDLVFRSGFYADAGCSDRWIR